MRRIEIETGLVLRFPQRSADFCDGMEIGLLAMQMASGADTFSRSIAAGNVEQARALADKLGYMIVASPAGGQADDESSVTVTLRKRGARPELRIVRASR